MSAIECDSREYAQALGLVVAHRRTRNDNQSQRTLASEVGVTQTTISRLERGEVDASVYVVRKVAAVLDYESAGELLNEVEEVLTKGLQQAKEAEKKGVPPWMLLAAGAGIGGILGAAIAGALKEKDAQQASKDG